MLMDIGSIGTSSEAAKALERSNVAVVKSGCVRPLSQNMYVVVLTYHVSVKLLAPTRTVFLSDVVSQLVVDIACILRANTRH